MGELLLDELSGVSEKLSAGVLNFADPATAFFKLLNEISSGQLMDHFPRLLYHVDGDLEVQRSLRRGRAQCDRYRCQA